MELSLFFPAYNEEDNIEKSVKNAMAILPKISEKFEIIIVDDGSKDRTLEVARRLENQFKQVKVVTQPNKGYGGALKLGFETAKYEWVFFTDADLQFNIFEIQKFLKYCPDNDLIIGYRIKRAEGIKRQALTVALRLWNWIFLSFPLSIHDTDCAFKLINKQVIENASPLLCNGAMISTELLLKASRAGFRLVQIPVKHYPRKLGRPTGNNFKVIFKAVEETFNLQKRLLLNRNSNNKPLFKTSFSYECT